MTDDPTDTMEPITENRAPVARLDRDMRNAAARLTDTEARYLVDMYYAMQHNRIRARNQIKAMGESEEPHEIIAWFGDNAEIMEKQIKAALQRYVLAHPAGEWAAAQKGIGPVIAAGMLARIDINRAPTVGHIWSFAGLDPKVEWKSGQKRPWNAALKRICWLAGEAFVKVCNRDGAFYGVTYKERKAFEEANNRGGVYADQARKTLEKKNIGKGTDAYLWYAGCFTEEAAVVIAATPTEKRAAVTRQLAGGPGSGTPMLPPARINERAKRYAVKLFLAHLHAVWYEAAFGTPPPLPYPIAHMGHTHKIDPPTAGKAE